MSDMPNVGRYNNVQPTQNFQAYNSAKDNRAEMGYNPLRNHFNNPQKSTESTVDNLNALPSGKAYKEGANILLPAKAFDVYQMNALYADTNNIKGEVKEINGNLYAKGENPVIEYTPKSQIIQPNNHILGHIKNAEADKRLESLGHHDANPYDTPLFEMLPKVIGGSIIGAIAGSLFKSPLLMLGSLGVAGGSLYLANEHFKKLSQPSEDAFSKKIASFS